MRTAFSKLDKILVKTGRYPSKREFIEDAIRTLLRAKPELKMDVTIELYKKEVERILGAGLPRPHFDPPVNGYVQVDQKLEPTIHI